MKKNTMKDNLLFELFSRVLDESISNSLETDNSPLFSALLDLTHGKTKEMLCLFFQDFSYELERIKNYEPDLIGNIIDNWMVNTINVNYAIQDAIVQLGSIKLEKHLIERTYALLTLIHKVTGEGGIPSYLYESIKAVWCQNTIKGIYCHREIELVCALVVNGDLTIVKDIEVKNIKTTFMVAACLSEAYKKIKGTSRGSIKFSAKELEKIGSLKESPIRHINNNEDWVSVFNKKYSAKLSLAWNSFTIDIVESVYGHVKNPFNKNKSILDDNELGKNIRATLKTQHYKSLISNFVQIINCL